MLSFTCKTSFALLLFLSVISFHGTICIGSSRIRCHQSDRRLLQIFRVGVNDSHNLLSSWSTQPDCCAWHGVHCDNITGRVTRLDLQCYNSSEYCLKGEINLCLLQLEFLNYLDLSYNDFETVRYPSTHSQKYHNQSLATSSLLYANFSSSLHYLDFSCNYDLHLDDLHWLSLVPSLKYLNLNSIDLHNQTNWLQYIAMLPSLSELSLSECQLHSISPPLKYVNFHSLVSLDLSNNYFDSELPDGLFNLSSEIAYVDLSLNNLQGQITKSLLNFQKLKFICLSENELNGSIPDWLGQLEHLEQLHLDFNSFSGSIPSSLGNLSSLVFLNLRFNGLSGNLPESLGQLSKLESLLVGGNSLGGLLSETHFKGLSNLHGLGLRRSTFVFDLHPNWIPPFQLRYLNLGYSNFGPIFPPWIYTQRSIEFLDISSSGISTIDKDKFWSSSVEYKYINMSNNSISGELSDVLLNCQIILLAHNNLKGGLPRISPNVIALDLSSNSFSGSMSPLLCPTINGDNKLLYLDLSNNLLTGAIPDCWMNWKYLTHIYLGSNQLSGEVSSSIGSLNDLQLIDLQNNSLSGNIPLSFKKCKGLKFLNLEGNNFSGSIPTLGEQDITVLKLSSNQLTGNIPSQLCQLSSLIVLDLADNKLSGSIPWCLSNIVAMDEVGAMEVSFNVSFHVSTVYDYLSSYSYKLKLHMKGREVEYLKNLHVVRTVDLSSYSYKLKLHMKGRELEYLRNLQFVRTVDLSSNNFTGEIPPELFELTALVSLNLSRNNLTGKIPMDIGGMKNLESLDLSNNLLAGKIPQSISNLSFLSYLNLSYNGFCGQIPSGTQLQSFDSWSYIGNPLLCGAPLTKMCTEEEKPIEKEHEESGTESWFYLGMGVGFAVGFWAVCGIIFFNRAFRHAYFQLVDRVGDRIYVVVALKFNMLH